MARIMVVEDEAAIADLILMNLKLVGHMGISVSNGNDVMKNIELHKPDLVILDIMLPGADGFQILKKIREISAVPVLMLTAKTDGINKVKGPFAMNKKRL